MKKALIFAFTLTFIFNACQDATPKHEKILDQVEAIVVQNPDSAVDLMNKILDIQDMKSPTFNRYVLLNIRAKYKSNRDIRQDTLIFDTYKWYAKQKDNLNTARSAYYCARVWQERQDPEKAMDYLLHANEAAIDISDFQLKGLIQGAMGEILYNKKIYNQASSHFAQAKDYFEQAKDYKNVVSSFNYLGLDYIPNNQPDSALLCYQKALSIAVEKDVCTKSRIYIIQNIGVAYRRQGKIDDAKESFKHALELTKDSITRSKIYIDLAKICSDQDQLDSARLYLQTGADYLPRINKGYAKANIYNLWSEVEHKSGNLEQALAYKQEYCQQLKLNQKNNQSKELVEAQRKYNYQLIRNENFKLQIKNQKSRSLNMMLAILLAVVAICGGYLLWVKSKKNKKRLAEAHDFISKLEEISEKSKLENAQVKQPDVDAIKVDNQNQSIVLQHFGVVRKLAAINNSLTEGDKKNGLKLMKKVNSIVYGSEVLDWERLYKTLNNYNNGVLDLIKKQYPSLSETEYKICCLAYAGCDNTEIGLILHLAMGSTRTLKGSMKKKLGAGKTDNILDYLNKNIKKN